jgi:chorismate dehydratase
VSDYPALAQLRIGCVKYLNARPLIDRYPGPVDFAHPSELATGMLENRLDAALVPVFEGLRHNDYLLVDGVAIAADGPVYSVFLAYRGELSEIRTVSLDPASLTSVHLLQVLLAEFHGLKPEYRNAAESRGDEDGQLLIGNQAIAYRAQAPEGTKYLDLAEEWKRCTGLPFVFALWLLRSDVPVGRAAADEFRALGAEGMRHLEEIIATERVHSQEFARKYLTEYIRSGLGSARRRPFSVSGNCSTNTGPAEPSRHCGLFDLTRSADRRRRRPWH